MTFDETKDLRRPEPGLDVMVKKPASRGCYLGRFEDRPRPIDCLALAFCAQLTSRYSRSGPANTPMLFFPASTILASDPTAASGSVCTSSPPQHLAVGSPEAPKVDGEMNRLCLSENGRNTIQGDGPSFHYSSSSSKSVLFFPRRRLSISSSVAQAPREALFPFLSALYSPIASLKIPTPAYHSEQPTF